MVAGDRQNSPGCSARYGLQVASEGIKTDKDLPTGLGLQEWHQDNSERDTMPRKPKRPRVPAVYKCQNPACHRTSALDTEGYRASVPSGTPADEVHYGSEPSGIEFSLLCASCGHYTVVSPREWRRSE